MKKVMNTALLSALAVSLVAQNTSAMYWPFGSGKAELSGKPEELTEQQVAFTEDQPAAPAAAPAQPAGYSKWITRGIPTALLAGGTAAAAYKYGAPAFAQPAVDLAKVWLESTIESMGSKAGAVWSRISQMTPEEIQAVKEVAAAAGMMGTMVAAYALSPSEIAQMKKTMPGSLTPEQAQMLLTLPTPLGQQTLPRPTAAEILQKAGSPEAFVPPALRKKRK